MQKYFSTIKRFLPSEQKSTAVGLDIGSGECKLVELSKSENTFEVTHWAIETIRNGDTKAAVQKILGRLSAPCKSLYTSVFGKGTLIRYIDMPRMSLDDLKSSFNIEADKYFPFAREQIYTDCCILEVELKEKEKTMSVLAAAAKRDMVDRRVTLLTELGLPVEFIGLNPIVLANALNKLGLGGEESREGRKDSVTALLDMGESVSSLTILINRLPCFTRDIFIGGRDFTKSISNALGIGFQDAEQLKRRPGERLGDVAQACDTAVMNMIQELRLSMDYFVTEKNREVDKLLLTGGASMLEGIAETFARNLEIEVSTWNPLSALKAAPGVPAADADNKSLKLGVAVGLALYPYD